MFWGRWLNTLIPVVYEPIETLVSLTFLGYKLGAGTITANKQFDTEITGHSLSHQARTCRVTDGHLKPRSFIEYTGQLILASNNNMFINELFILI
jgi:hypothetical protein